MRKAMSMFVIVTVLMIAACSPVVVPDWELVREMTIGQKAYYAGFSGELDGITVGYAGAVDYTNDGGQLWNVGTNKSACRFGLEILPNGFAWNSGNGGEVRSSRDGGMTWQEISGFGKSTPEHARFISFADTDHGFIASNNRLGYTETGGKDWIPLAAPGKNGSIAVVSLTKTGQNSLVGHLIDGDGSLWVTKDNGKNWTEENSPVKSTGIKLFPTVPIAALRFQPAGDGVLAGYFIADKETGNLQFFLFTTDDFGASWKQGCFPENDLGLGSLFISHDGKFITFFDLSKTIRLYERSK